jgi:hypothetical protein
MERICTARVTVRGRVAGRKQQEYAKSFGAIMQVVRFIDPDWLVEIEADAVLESQP